MDRYSDPWSARGLSRRALLFAGATAIGTRVAWAEGPPELVIGLTPVVLSTDLDVLEELKAYLEVAAARPVRLVTRRTYQEITSLLVTGQLDAAWICGFPFVAFRRQLSLVAVPVWRGRPLYQSYLISDRDRADCDGIEDLQGDVHAFSDPDSNSGFLVTRALLAQRERRPEEFFRKTFFTFGHRNVVRAVAAGLAQSGSVDGYVWEVLTETEPELTGQTRIVSRSEFLGFPPIATSNEKAATQSVAALRQALLKMPDSQQGRRLLALLRLDGFSLADPSLFNSIAARMDLVRGAR